MGRPEPGGVPIAARCQYGTSDDADGRAQALQQLNTIRDFIRYGVSRFEHAGLSFGHGTDNAFDEVVYLVLWALHLPPDDLEPFIDARLTTDEAKTIMGLLDMRIETRQPAAYLTGQAWLHGLSFVCDQRALVPRSPIVEALYSTLPEWLTLWLGERAAPPWPARVLDLCTGGGSIAIHAACVFPDTHVIATDISEPALALCAQNIVAHGLQDRVKTVRSDLMANLPAADKFDLILCNPPYVPDSAMEVLPAEYQREPDAALRGGADGMLLIEKILSQAAGRLSENGAIIIELGHEATAFELRFNQLTYSWLPVSAGEQMLVAATHDQLVNAT